MVRKIYDTLEGDISLDCQSLNIYKLNNERQMTSTNEVAQWNFVVESQEWGHIFSSQG